MSGNAVSRGDLIRLLSIAAGASVFAYVNVESVIDYTIAKFSSLATPCPSGPADPITAAINSASGFVDERLLRAEIRLNLEDFDRKSPVSHTTIVRILLSLTAITATKAVLRRMV